MPSFVRPFQTRDRQALLAIGADTAFFGAPIERYLEDRRLFMDGFYAYYTDYEPEHSWVACADEQVVGFLVGCFNSRRQNQTLRKEILPGLLQKLLRGEYRMGPKTWRYLRSIAGALLRREVPPVDENAYPAHLHINLLPSWRGQGLGRQLIEAYLQQLRENQIPGVHLHTTSQNKAAVHLYEKTGFRLVSARPTRMYAYLVAEPVSNLCYGLRLTPA